LTAKIKPVNPGFCLLLNPAYGFENGWVCPGFRVPGYPGCIP